MYIRFYNNFSVKHIKVNKSMTQTLIKLFYFKSKAKTVYF